MPQTKSEIRNNKIILRNRSRNKKYKLAIKKAIKSYLFAIKNNSQGDDQKELEQIYQNKLSYVYKVIDKAVKTKVLHKNKAARKKSSLAKIIK